MRSKKVYFEDEAEEASGNDQSEFEDDDHIGIKEERISDTQAEKKYFQIMKNRQARGQQLQDRLNYYVRAEDGGVRSDSSIGDCQSKIWRMDCRRGSEFDKLFQISQYLAHIRHGDILSIFLDEKIRGALFFECPTHQLLVKSLKGLWTPEVTLVKDEFISELMQPKQVMDIQNGQWIRIKKHPLYKGDLAKVMRTNGRTQKAQVKVIPRDAKTKQQIPLSCPIIVNQREDLEEYQLSAEAKSNFIYESLADEKKVAKLDGFKLIWIHRSRIDINIQIAEQELQLFYPDIKDVKLLADQAKKEISKRVDVQFNLGDKVRMAQDCDKSPEFTITQIHPDGMLELEYQKQSYILHGSQVKLAFKLYQQVQVTDGPHKGIIGIVCQIKPNSILLDCDTKVINISHSLLTATISHIFNEFSLVRFGSDNNDLGCVINYRPNSSTVLTLNNVIREFKNIDLKVLRNYKTRIEFNTLGEALAFDDLVVVMYGKYKDQQAKVKHAVNQKLFLYNSKFPNSIILEDASNCKLFIARPIIVIDKSMLGSMITIKQGPHRGLKGMVTKVVNSHMTVSLSCRSQTVVIPYNAEYYQESMF